MQLTANFSLDEFLRSNTAEYLGIDNSPNEEQLENLHNLANALQILRNHIGMAISINSGLRVDDLNNALGATPKSYHRFGLAADIVCHGMSVKELSVLAATKIPLVDKVIAEDLLSRTWSHVQISKPGRTPRQQWFNATDKPGGGVIYTRVENDFETIYGAEV